MLTRKGQSLVEYAVLIIIILGVFIAMQNYIKRGIQGRWKSATDDLGEQYDPRLANSHMLFTTVIQSDTHIVTVPAQSGYYTNRLDTSSSYESKTGVTTVAAQGDGT